MADVVRIQQLFTTTAIVQSRLHVYSKLSSSTNTVCTGDIQLKVVIRVRVGAIVPQQG